MTTITKPITIKLTAADLRALVSHFSNRYICHNVASAVSLHWHVNPNSQLFDSKACAAVIAAHKEGEAFPQSRWMSDDFGTALFEAASLVLQRRNGNKHVAPDSPEFEGIQDVDFDWSHLDGNFAPAISYEYEADISIRRAVSLEQIHGEFESFEFLNDDKGTKGFRMWLIDKLEEKFGPEHLIVNGTFGCRSHWWE